MAPDSKLALVGLGIMCLSTSLLSSFSGILPISAEDNVPRFAVLLYASFGLSVP